MSNFNSIVDRFALDASDRIMEELVNEAMQNNITDEEIAYLAKRMAKSGTIIRYAEKKRLADIVSTGGPSSLSTLLGPLFLRSFGYVVPKLGVPGRPAGGIDVLAQIPGYQYELDESKIKDIISLSKYVHFLVSHKYAPLDASLFDFRKRHGALNIPALVIASILAKKIALGVELVGLDIRVASHGNFGASWEIARQNAQRFCRVADLVDCKSICFLADNRVPFQPFLGRGESLLALSLVFTGCAPTWLQNHVDMCYAMVRILAVNDSNPSLPSRPSHTDLLSLFDDNLKAQGTSLEAFTHYVNKIKKDHSYELLSLEDGFVVVDHFKIRDVITSLQSQTADSQTHFPDPCGLILKKNHGQYVQKGEQIASIRLSGRPDIDPVIIFREAIRVQPEPQSGFLFEEVKHG